MSKTKTDGVDNAGHIVLLQTVNYTLAVLLQTVIYTLVCSKVLASLAPLTFH